MKRELRKFAFTMALVLGGIGCIFWWRGKEFYVYFATVSIWLFLFGIVAPTLLTPLYRAWMSFSFFLSRVMTKIILSILFYSVITPIGLLKRLFTQNSLGLKFSNDLDTYWIKRELLSKDVGNDERQF